MDKRSEELESASTERVEQIRRSWKDHAQKFEHGIVDQRFDTNAEAARTLIEHPKVSIWRQIRVLTARTSLVTLRDPMGVIGSFVEAVLMGITLGWIFYQLDGSLQGIRSRQSAIYVAAALQEYLILMYETYRLTMDIEIFDRERNEGVVGVTAFLISRRLAKVVEDVGVSVTSTLALCFAHLSAGTPGLFDHFLLHDRFWSRGQSVHDILLHLVNLAVHLRRFRYALRCEFTQIRHCVAPRQSFVYISELRLYVQGLRASDQLLTHLQADSSSKYITFPCT